MAALGELVKWHTDADFGTNSSFYSAIATALTNAKLLPKTCKNFTASAVQRTVDKKMDAARAIRAMRVFVAGLLKSSNNVKDKARAVFASKGKDGDMEGTSWQFSWDSPNFDVFYGQLRKDIATVSLHACFVEVAAVDEWLQTTHGISLLEVPEGDMTNPQALLDIAQTASTDKLLFVSKDSRGRYAWVVWSLPSEEK